MRLVRAELLKARRRTATYVVFIVVIVLMVLTYLVTGGVYQFAEIIEFPAAYGLIAQFAFAMGGLLAIVYTAAFVGADWNWGVLRNVVARGESRMGYLLAKAAALAILLAIAEVIIVALGIALTYLQGFLYNVPVTSPLRGRGIQDLLELLVLGYPVLLQRAAIGLAVAVVLRSQLAGAVVGFVLFLGETIVTTVLTLVTFGTRFSTGSFDPDSGPLGFEPIGPEWFQFLPISIGGNVLNALPGGGGLVSEGGIQNLFIRPVPFEIALSSVLLYLVASTAIAILALQRQEIV